MTRKPVVTTKPGEDMPPTEIIAQSIIEISAAMKRLTGTRLKTSAIVLLVQAETKLTRQAIVMVLDALASLEATYLKPVDIKKVKP